jgi:signal transduction histidine kinase
MRLSIKTKQVAGVVLIVGLAVVVLSAIHLAWIARIHLRESLSRGEMVAQFVFERASNVVTTREQAYSALQGDPGLRSLLLSSIAYSEHVTYAAIVDPRNVAIVHSSPTLEGQTLEPQPLLTSLLEQGAIEQFQAISGDRTFEVQQPLLMRREAVGAGGGNEQFGSIRVGVSTTLIRRDLRQALLRSAWTAFVSLIAATLIAWVLAQWTLKPVHVLKSGLSRLGRGEFDVKLDLPPGDEFGELGSSFNMLSAELSSIRSQLAAGQAAPFESVVDRLEDAVAMFNPDGQLLFANAAMRAALPEQTAGVGFTLQALPLEHPYRTLVEQTLATRRAQGPVSEPVLLPNDDGREVEQLMTAHAIEHADRRFLGVMLVARNLGYLSQVQSTLRYSRKLASLGRLLAGVAHEVKNPLNAMTIHLELLKQKLSGGAAALSGGRGLSRQAGEGATLARGSAPTAATLTDGEAAAASDKVLVEVPAVMKHVTVISAEIRRLDEVVQGFLKFSRPEELQLEPVDLSALVREVSDVVDPQARDAGVAVTVDCPTDLPPISADRPMLRQALLNLVLNACQAMPSGGTLRFTARLASDRRVSLVVEDSGIGIAPEHLSRIFDLYFTTREQGSGIGLSMVYQTVQLHDGSIEVQSTPGHGTAFTLLLPQA